MSLMDDFTSACVILDKKRVPDGEGGFTITWTEGAKFMAAIVLNTSIEARAAGQTINMADFKDLI